MSSSCAHHCLVSYPDTTALRDQCEQCYCMVGSGAWQASRPQRVMTLLHISGRPPTLFQIFTSYYPPSLSPMSMKSPAPRTPNNASGFLALRLFMFLSSKRPSAQERQGDRRLDEARDLAQRNEDLISSSQLKIAEDKLLQCVRSSQCRYSGHVQRPSARRKSR